SQVQDFNKLLRCNQSAPVNIEQCELNAVRAESRSQGDRQRGEGTASGVKNLYGSARESLLGLKDCRMQASQKFRGPMKIEDTAGSVFGRNGLRVSKLAFVRINSDVRVICYHCHGRAVGI